MAMEIKFSPYSFTAFRVLLFLNVAILIYKLNKKNNKSMKNPVYSF